jgi:Tfp pilus assembly protein PilF
VTALGQAADPAYAPLEKAFEALRARNYDVAIDSFERAIAAAPQRADIRKNLAYALLKIGETEAARDQFAEAMRLDSTDQHVALEYAFLCYETKQQAIARRVFDRLRRTGDKTAEDAFQNIDKPLAEGIARWTAALAMSPDNFSAHEELARLAEQRDDLSLAAEHYERAWRLKPSERSLLLDLGRVWKAQGRQEDAMSALLAASRGAQPRVAEKARELLPSRYPYVYEFQNAIKIDSSNADLRRELADLLVAMNHRPVLGEAPARIENAKTMAEKSLKAGYLNDALRYLLAAQEADPQDFEVMLKLGWTYNMLHDDRDAIRWFDLASQSEDPGIALEAAKAYKNLKPQFQRFRFTVWAFPFYSSRWRDAFGYGQVKEEMKLGGLPLRVYLGARFIGDTRGTIGTEYLSESSIIFEVGLSTAAWRGLSGWAEAGESVKYVSGAAIPDYRGGLSYAKGFGHMMGGLKGWFAESNDDGVYVSRFQNDMLLYSQNRTGYTFASAEDLLGGFQAQLYWNYNLTTDRLKQYWANYVETGPGIRFKSAVLPKGMLFSVNFLRGVYLANEDNPRRPNFFDLRAGFWYAFTR